MDGPIPRTSEAAWMALDLGLFRLHGWGLDLGLVD